MLSPGFIHWLKNGGVEVRGVEAAHVEEGWRGIVARNQIQPGSLLVRVPERLLLSVHSAERDVEFSLVLKEKGQQLKSNEILAAFLLHEISKGAESFWHPYLESLPTHYTCLSCFSRTEAEELQVEYAKDVAFEALDALHLSHRRVKPLLAALGHAPKYSCLAAWKWATATVASRTMYLPDDEAGALTPFGDLHNHKAPPGPAMYQTYGCEPDAHEDECQQETHGNGYFDVSTQEYKLYAQTQYETGEQVFLCYGAHTNLQLLEHYGFISRNNPHDKAKLPWELLPESFRGSVEAEACWLHPSGLPSWELMRELRLWTATQLGLRHQRHLALEGLPISPHCECYAFDIIRKTCIGALERLPTTMDEDADLLSQGGLSVCMCLAVTWRLAYKRMLQNAIQRAKEALANL